MPARTRGRVPLTEELREQAAAAEEEAPLAALRSLEALDDDFISRALELGKGSNEVLDAACGAGQIAVRLAAGNPAWIVHAIDASDRMLSRAAVLAGRRGVGMRILLNRGSAASIPYETATFDLVVACGALRLRGDPAAVVREVGRVCRPGGAILLAEPRRPLLEVLHLWRQGRAFKGELRRLFAASVRAGFTMPEMRALVHETGVPGLRPVEMGSARVGLMRAARRIGDGQGSPAVLVGGVPNVS